MKAKLAPVRSLLEGQTTLVLATVDQHLMPRATPLFYIADEALRLYWFSSRWSLHSQNCRRNPQASAAVYRPASGWRQICGAQLQGSVAVVAERGLRRSIAQKYGARFGLGDRFVSVLGRSTLYCFTPRWARYLDNARRFGDKFEIELRSPSVSSSSGRRSSGTGPSLRARPRAD